MLEEEVAVPLLVLQEPVIVQELLEVPFSSSVKRVLQPTDVEEVLDVPVLHIDEDDSILNEFLELVALQETPEVQASSSAAVVVQEQVIVQPLPEARVPRQRVQQRTVEQVADSRVPPALSGIVEQMVDVPVPGRISSVVSERIVEQVMDVPVSGGAHSRRAHVQQSTGSSAAALDASQERIQGVFRTFSPEEKVRRLPASRLRNWCGTPAHGRLGLMRMWIPG